MSCPTFHLDHVPEIPPPNVPPIAPPPPQPPPIEEERGPQVPVELPGDPGEPERVQ